MNISFPSSLLSKPGLELFLLVKATDPLRQPSPPASAMARAGNGFPLLPGPGAALSPVGSLNVPNFFNSSSINLSSIMLLSVPFPAET